MALAVGQTSKGRSASSISQATGGVTTQASGSTFWVIGIWDTTNFSSIVDSKGNTYTIENTEVPWGIGSAKMRAYHCENGAGGASHTATITLSGAGPILVLFLEITGAAVASFDTANRLTDNASPFVSSSLSNAQAASMYVSAIGDDSGSNPATLACASFNVQAGASETNGVSFYVGGIATQIVASIAARTASWTSTGANNSAVWEAIFKELIGGGGGGSLAARRSLLGVGV